MPFSDLEEVIKDLNFEQGFHKGVFIAENKWEFLTEEHDIKYFNTREFKKAYKFFFNQPQKRR